MLNTLLFDLDGTLIDSNELIIASFQKVLAEFMPNRSFSRQEIIAMIGPPLWETFAGLTDDPVTNEKMISRYRKTYCELEFAYIDIYPHVIDTLIEFKNKGFNLAIVTTKFKISALPSIIHFGIDHLISTIISLDDVDNHKPHPEPIQKALAAFLGCEEAMMVGDSPSDIMAGKNAGILTCGVSWTLKPKELSHAKPDYMIDDFRDLSRIVAKYNKED